MIVFFRALLLYIVIIFAVRMMGKRQLGDLQPSEVVTTISPRFRSKITRFRWRRR